MMRTMQWIIAAAVLIVAGMAPAAVLVNEDFSGYSQGALVGQSAQGQGLTGTWTGDNTNLDVIAGDTVRYDRPNDWNAKRAAQAATESGQPFSDFLASNGTVFYAGLRVRLDDDSVSGDGTPDSDPTGDARAQLFFDGNPLSFGLYDDGTFGIEGGQSSGIFGGTYSTGTDYLLVLRVVYNPGGDDTSEAVKLWVNPTSEADVPVIDDTDNLLFNSWTSFNAVGVYGENRSGNWADFGQVVVGESFADVIPEPASMALLGLGGLAGILRRRRA
ncbi:MAG: PEP-CTERM sorting domain-containing protein [Phycisphaerae bacterium]